MQTKKILLLILLITILSIVFMSNTYATTLDEILTSGDNFLESGAQPGSVIDESKLKSTSSTIYKVLLSIAICVAVIIGAIIGIQFIMGSVEGKAKIMEALVPYIVGCVVVFGAFTIWGIVVNMGDSAIGSEKVTVLTPPTTCTCSECGEKVEIPAGVIAGGRQYPCPKCRTTLNDWK